MAIELQPLVMESSLTMQKLLEAEDHKARLKLLKYFMDAECRRLDTKKRLKGIFSSGSLDASTSATSSTIPKEEMLLDKEDKPATSRNDGDASSSKSIFFDEPDAFQ
jgi:hypothetical protein